MDATSAGTSGGAEAPPEQGHHHSDGIRRFPSHERLDSMFSTLGIMKGKGGKPKSSRLADTKPLSSRVLVTSMLVLVFCLLMNQVGLFVPLVIMARNCILSKQPLSVTPKYGFELARLQICAPN